MYLGRAKSFAAKNGFTLLSVAPVAPAPGEAFASIDFDMSIVKTDAPKDYRYDWSLDLTVKNYFGNVVLYSAVFAGFSTSASENAAKEKATMAAMEKLNSAVEEFLSSTKKTSQ